MLAVKSPRPVIILKIGVYAYSKWMVIFEQDDNTHDNTTDKLFSHNLYALLNNLFIQYPYKTKLVNNNQIRKII